MSNSDRFLDTFNEIERFLRKTTKEEQGTGFRVLVDKASKSDPAVRAFKDDLKEFADLRNAIVHESRDGRTIAEPNDWAVEELERMASLILDSPKIIPMFRSEVHTLQMSDPVASAVKSMFDHSFSQIPIYDGQKFIGLLTTDTVARWLGASVAEDIFSLTETPIADALKHTEERDNFCFLKRDATLFEASEIFGRYERNGKRLEAVLITQTGKPVESLLGIITIWDLPKIHRELKGS